MQGILESACARSFLPWVNPRDVAKTDHPNRAQQKLQVTHSAIHPHSAFNRMFPHNRAVVLRNIQFLI